MMKFKICPDCGTQNAVNSFECINCECDLASVPVTDNSIDIEKDNSSSSKETTKKNENCMSDSQLVRVCECGHVNPFSLRKCEACHSDISYIMPECQSQCEKIKYYLKSYDNKYLFVLEKEEYLMGREKDLKDYLADKMFVSRVHCKVSIENESLFVENLSNTNKTFVNNEEILSRVQLKCGDELALGGKEINGERQSMAAYFIIGQE